MATDSGARSRALAAKALVLVLQKGRRLEDALESALPPGFDDRALVMAMCAGVLRFERPLRALALMLLDRPLRAKDEDVACLLLVGLFQIEHLRVPDYAAISATVGAAKTLRKLWAKGLLNALLRRFLREREALLARLSSAERSAHPDWLLQRFKADWPAHWPDLVAANNRQGAMNLRLNCGRKPLPEALQALDEAEISVAHAALDSQQRSASLRLAKPVEPSVLPGFEQAWLSVQDTAAQAASLILASETFGTSDSPAGVCLDACAAPGGKTSHLVELSEAAGGSMAVVAVEMDADRALRIDENLERLGLDAQVVLADLSDEAVLDAGWASAGFDVVLLDAPCSATGVIRRHPDIKALRRESDLPALVATQAQLLEHCWSLLKPGGRLLYATCSVLREENDGQVLRFLERHSEACALAVEWPFEGGGYRSVETALGLQLLPSLDAADGGEGPGFDQLQEHQDQDRQALDHDGFFYALLERKAVPS